MQISRLFEIVYLLMHHEQMTAKELAHRFEISQRTVYRDIEALCQAGVPIYTTKGKGGGIRLLDEFVLNKSILSSDEQEEILSALQGLRSLPYVAAEPVLDKLSALFHTGNPDWIEVDFTNWSDREEEKDRFSQLKQAILQRQTIQFDYFNARGETTHRTVEPLKIFFKGQAWYLYGICLQKKEARFFKLSRMQDLSITGPHFSGRDVSLETEFVQPRYQARQIDLLLKFDASISFRICDEMPRSTLTFHEDGSITVQVTLAEDYLYHYLMTFADNVEVMQPLAVREELNRLHRRAAEKNC